MPSFRQWLDLRLGGARDNIALLSALGGGMLAQPGLVEALGSSAARAAGFGLSALGAGLLSDRLMSMSDDRVYASAIKINSDTEHALEDVAKLGGSDGILLGYTVDTGKPIFVSWDDWMRHVFVVGQSGMGKTVLGSWVMFQQIARGGGLMWIDGKLDADNIVMLNAMCAWAGRRDELDIINPGDPEQSNSYNPILYGDPDEVADRMLSLLPSTENNPGADFYRQSAKQAITTMIGAIQATGYAYNFADLAILLQNDRALEYLQSLIPRHKEEYHQFALFLEQYKAPDRNGMVRIDLKKLRDTFGGFGGRMHMFGTGYFGRVTGSYTPDVNLFESIVRNRIVYLALPTMGKPEAASNFGKMAIGDFRTAIADVQKLPKPQRPWPPYLGFFDEAGSYVTPAWSRMFEQARSAQLVMMPAVQTMANLDAVSEELREMVIGSTEVKIAFRIGTHDTAERFSDLFGTELTTRFNLSAGRGGGVSASAGTGQKQSLSFANNTSYSESSEEVHRITTNDLFGLERGECIVSIGGKNLYHVKVPQIKFSSEFTRRVGPPEINRYRRRYAKGLRLFENADKWIS